VAGKDATKPFKKTHNERILKTWQYKDLCVGVVSADAPNVQEKERSGRLGRMFGWGSKKKVEIEVTEIGLSQVTTLASVPETTTVVVEIATGGLSASNLDARLKGIQKSEEENIKGRPICEVISKDIGIVAL
jgi:hypothetical protein